jgi:hypothetical protein
MGPAGRRQGDHDRTNAVIATEVSVLLAEIQSHWDSIATGRRADDRNFAWMFLFLAGTIGLVASNAIEVVTAYVQAHPGVLLAAAVVTMWFPILFAIIWLDIASMAIYLRLVAYPRLAALTAANRMSLPPDVRRSLPKISPSDGLLSWESSQTIRHRNPVVVGLFVLRTAGLFAPAFLSIGIWAALRFQGSTDLAAALGRISVVNWVCLALVVLLIAALAYAALLASPGPAHFRAERELNRRGLVGHRDLLAEMIGTKKI